MNKHRQALELALCERDYNLLAQYHSDLLETIEEAISDGIGIYDIRRWAMAVVNESDILQRVFNAARYATWLRERAT